MYFYGEMKIPKATEVIFLFIFEPFNVYICILCFMYTTFNGSNSNSMSILWEFLRAQSIIGGFYLKSRFKDKILSNSKIQVFILT